MNLTRLTAKKIFEIQGRVQENFNMLGVVSKHLSCKEKGVFIDFDEIISNPLNWRDITALYVNRLEKILDIKEYIGVQKSPSCGCGKTYDRTFSKKLINGDGVTIALLKREDIQIKTEKEL